LKIRWAEFEAKPIPLETWKDVQVDVKDLLPGYFAIGEEEVNALAPQITPVQSGSDALTNFEEMPAGFFVEGGQVRGVGDRDDEDVAGVDGLDVHEGSALFVPVDEAGRKCTHKDFAENAVSHFSISERKTRAILSPISLQWSSVCRAMVLATL
jgi:hypothetical protein